MTEARSAPIGKILVPALVVLTPLALYGIGVLRARAQETPAKEPGEKHPGPSASDTILTDAQEKALELKTVQAKKWPGRDHPIVMGGKVSLDLEHTARVRPLLSSIIFEVKKHAGDEVERGDELLVVESTDLGDAKNNYLTALANLEVAAETYRREALLRARQATTESDFFTARAAFRTAAVAAEAAREKALLLGVIGSELRELEDELPKRAEVGSTGLEPPPANDAERAAREARQKKEREDDARASLEEIDKRHAHRTPETLEESRRRARYTIRAPVGGTLIAKDAARGELIDPSQIIATVSDLRQVWIQVDVYQKDIPKVKRGASVTVTTPSYPDIPFAGSVTFLSESVDDTTHTLKARVVVDNGNRLLKSGMAAKLVVHCLDEVPKIELPPEAIVREGEETFVIVQKGQGHYERRRVKLGFEGQDSVHVEEGLQEGETVVSEGNLFIHTKIPLGD